MFVFLVEQKTVKKPIEELKKKKTFAKAYHELFKHPHTLNSFRIRWISLKTVSDLVRLERNKR